MPNRELPWLALDEMGSFQEVLWRISVRQSGRILLMLRCGLAQDPHLGPPLDLGSGSFSGSAEYLPRSRNAPG